MVTRADVEKALWLQSAWQIEQEDVDRIMEVVDAYAANGQPPPPSAPVQTPPPPATVLDLPLAERKRLLDRENRVAAEEFERGRLAGLLQADEERSREAAVRPSAALNPLPASSGPGKTYKAADGTLWLALGVPQEIPLGVIPAQRQSGEEYRRCNKCSILKPIGRFTKDPRGKNGLRGQCKDCEAEVRAAKKQRDGGEEAA